MGLTNSIILESSTQFPIGWLCGAPIAIILLHCCSCLKRFIPHVFYIETDSLRTYEFLHDQWSLIFGALAWSSFTFGVLVYVMIILKMYVWLLFSYISHYLFFLEHVWLLFFFLNMSDYFFRMDGKRKKGKISKIEIKQISKARSNKNESRSK
jgi:hypothetical protein